jgi:4'-phosphopantetheinyl transferase EntD
MMLFRSLLPACVLCAEMDPVHADPSLLALEEAQQIQSSVEKRRREYTSGRLLARSLLSNIGIDNFKLINSPNRTPKWPEGVHGSITHCDTLCVVAISNNHIITGIGIDVEPAEPLPQDAEKFVMLADEYSSIKKLPAALQSLATRLIFSTKEATYKAVYPRLQLFLDFSDVHVEIHEAGTFTATLLHTTAANRIHNKIDGRYHIDDRHIGTSVVLY